jgi:hypothetical protein
MPTERHMPATRMTTLSLRSESCPENVFAIEWLPPRLFMTCGIPLERSTQPPNVNESRSYVKRNRFKTADSSTSRI